MKMMECEGDYMRRNINKKKNNNKKTIIVITISLFFLMFFSTAMAVSDRNFIFPENVFKEMVSFINKKMLIKKCGNNNLSDDVINSMIESLKKENNELRKSLNLKENNNKLIIAQVTGNLSKTWEGKVLLDRGFNDNIKKKMPVITADGLVGFVSKVSKNVSEVSLITMANENNLISVKIEDQDDGLTGVISGYDIDKKSFIVTDVVSKKEIQKDASVVTNISGKNGIFIGKVTDSKSDDYGLTKTVFVKSNVNFNNLQFLMIVGD